MKHSVDHSRSSELTRIDRVPTTSYPW